MGGAREGIEAVAGPRLSRSNANRPSAGAAAASELSTVGFTLMLFEALPFSAELPADGAEAAGDVQAADGA